MDARTEHVEGTRATYDVAGPVLRPRIMTEHVPTLEVDSIEHSEPEAP